MQVHVIKLLFISYSLDISIKPPFDSILEAYRVNENTANNNICLKNFIF